MTNPPFLSGSSSQGAAQPSFEIAAMPSVPLSPAAEMREDKRTSFGKRITGQKALSQMSQVSKKVSDFFKEAMRFIRQSGDELIPSQQGKAGQVNRPLSFMNPLSKTASFDDKVGPIPLLLLRRGIASECTFLENKLEKMVEAFSDIKERIKDLESLEQSDLSAPEKVKQRQSLQEQAQLLYEKLEQTIEPKLERLQNRIESFQDSTQHALKKAEGASEEEKAPLLAGQESINLIDGYQEVMEGTAAILSLNLFAIINCDPSRPKFGSKEEMEARLVLRELDQGRTTDLALTKQEMPHIWQSAFVRKETSKPSFRKSFAIPKSLAKHASVSEKASALAAQALALFGTQLVEKNKGNRLSAKTEMALGTLAMKQAKAIGQYSPSWQGLESAYQNASQRAQVLLEKASALEQGSDLTMSSLLDEKKQTLLKKEAKSLLNEMSHALEHLTHVQERITSFEGSQKGLELEKSGSGSMPLQEMQQQSKALVDQIRKGKDTLYMLSHMLQIGIYHQEML
ncbi:MAG: hypothetical protein K0S07_1092 [Chlamydiales bacterium]|jgi:hypothetical protein|nr:hypothetical protein [Chlamydiales bacterium]